MTSPTEKNPAAIETAGLEIAIQRQPLTGDAQESAKITTAAGAVEKAAPIPADVLALARETVAQVHEAEGNHHAAFRVREGYMDNRAPMLVALSLLADRASQGERIREDERDRLYEEAVRRMSEPDFLDDNEAAFVQRFLSRLGAMQPSDRARLRGDALSPTHWRPLPSPPQDREEQ